jgi:hypothetical protein
MRFRISNLLIVMTVVAMAFLPLMTPSVKWALGLPTFACVVSIYVTSRLIATAEGWRLFWTAFLIGCAAYLAGVALVSVLSSAHSPFARRSIWDEYVGVPVWRMIHGESVFTSNRQGVLNEDFVSFLIWVHVVLAMLLSGIAALLAQLIAVWRSYQQRQKV